jgi:hypothetical protein
MRSRILWGVRDHEDDKYYLATRFEQSLRDHASISDEALRQSDIAYRQLTDREPTNAAEYASRGIYVVMFQDKDAESVDDATQQIERRLGDSPHLIHTKYFEDGKRITVLALVRGSSGMKWLVGKLQAEPQVPVNFADLVTPELIRQAENNVLGDFEKHLSPPR